MQIRRLVAAASRGEGRHSSEQASERASLTRLYRVFRVTRAHRPRTNEIFSSGQADRPIRKAFQLVGPFARSRSRNNFHSRIALSASLSFRSTRPESSWTSSAIYHRYDRCPFSLYFLSSRKVELSSLGKDMLERERDFHFFDILEIWIGIVRKYCKIFSRNVFVDNCILESF